MAACPAGSRRFQLQSITACSVRCRCGASRAPPRSTANPSSRRRAISATDMTRTRAPASSAASGNPSRRPHSSRTACAGRSASGRAARARCSNSSAVVGRSSSGSRYTDSDDRPSGARLVVSTRRSLLSHTRACTRSAAPRTTCSQLSSTSSAGPGPRAAAIPAGRPGGPPPRPTGLPPSSPTPRADATSAVTSLPAATPASSTTCTTRCSAWALTACARRVLPRPPVPTIDVTREVRSRPATAAMSSSRPSSGLGSCRTPRRITGASACSSSWCTPCSAGPGSLPSSSRSR